MVPVIPAEQGDADAGAAPIGGSDAPERALDALQRYRTAEAAMRKRIRDALALNETDLAAVRFVLDATRQGEVVTPTDLMNRLGVTMASVTVMIDRLERGGHLVRAANPLDRRSRLVAATDLAEREVRPVLDAVAARLLEAVQSMEAAELDAAVAFLTRLSEAAAAEPPPPSPR